MFADLTLVGDRLEALIAEFDIDTLSGPESARAAIELGRIRKLTDVLIARVSVRVDATAAHAAGNDKSAEEFVARSTGVSKTEAKSLADTARRLEDLPATRAKVDTGQVSMRDAATIAGAARANPAAEQRLLEAAARGGNALRDAAVAARAEVEDEAARSRRQRRLHHLRTWIDDDGMVAGRFRLTPEVGAAFLASVEARTRAIFRARRKQPANEHEPMDCYAADALVELVTRSEEVPAEGQPAVGETTDAPASTVPTEAGPTNVPAADPTNAQPNRATRRKHRPSTSPYTVHIFVDQAVLQRGNALPGERCEIPGVGPVNAQWVREILGDAFVTSIIRKGVDISTVTHHGRNIPAVLETALIVQGRECDIEGCDCRGYLERDHVEIDFAKNGPTALWNLIWLCYRHHLRKSAGGRLSSPDPHTRKRRFVSERSRAA